MEKLNLNLNALTEELNLDCLEKIFTIASRFKNIDTFNKTKKTKDGKIIEFTFNRLNDLYYADNQVLTINNITDQTCLNISWLVNRTTLGNRNDISEPRSVSMKIEYCFPNKDILILKYENFLTTDTMETFRKHKFTITEVTYYNKNISINHNLVFNHCDFKFGKSLITIYPNQSNPNIIKVKKHFNNSFREFDFNLDNTSQIPINDCPEYSCSYQDLLNFNVSQEQENLRRNLDEIKRKLNPITVNALNLEPLYRSLDNIGNIKNDYQLVVSLFFEEFFKNLNQAIQNTTNNSFDLELLKEIYRMINDSIQERKAEIYNEQNSNGKKRLKLFKRK